MNRNTTSAKLQNMRNQGKQLAAALPYYATVMWRFLQRSGLPMVSPVVLFF
jgi:hypothetical protein